MAFIYKVVCLIFLSAAARAPPHPAFMNAGFRHVRRGTQKGVLPPSPHTVVLCLDGVADAAPRQQRQSHTLKDAGARVPARAGVCWRVPT